MADKTTESSSPKATAAEAAAPKAAPPSAEPAVEAAGESETGKKANAAAAMSIDMIRNIPVTLSVVLGSVSIPVSSLMKMQRGEIISLGRKVGEPVEVLANGKLIARGEIVVLEEEEPTFAISLTELVGSMAPGAGGPA